MFSTRVLHILILALAIGYVARASVPMPANLAYRALIERQGGGDNTAAESTDISSALAPSSTAEEEITSAPPEVSSTLTSAAPPPAETTSSSSAIQEEQPEETSPPPQQTSSTSTRTVTQNAPDPTITTQGPRPTTGGGPAQEEEDTSSSTRRLVVSTSFDVITRTLEDGTRQTTTSATRVTNTLDLNGGDEDDSESGMSEDTRNTVIGVVVGIGGAILLGALGVVFWRLRGRKRQAEEADGLMAYDSTYGNPDKPERGSSPTNTAVSAQRNPFQSTLENYHQPTPVNPSSNF